VARAARDRWQADKARLAAVERLLAARRAAQRAELARREAKAADDLAGQRWLRAREAAS
jgi:flagellar biosynthesis chaperone FliJ